jgi:hypothetical protein
MVCEENKGSGQLGLRTKKENPKWRAIAALELFYIDFFLLST